MKKQLIVLMASVFLILGCAQAQGGMLRQTPEERTTAAMEKIEAVLKPTESVRTNAKLILVDFFNSQQKAMEEMRASGTMDREAMMSKRKELSDNRDAKLKVIFTEEQMKKWINEVEPSLRTQRRSN